MIQDQIPEIKALSPSDKLALVVELWDELSAHPGDLPVSEEHWPNSIGVTPLIKPIPRLSSAGKKSGRA